MSSKRVARVTVAALATFFATAGAAYAQMPDDASAVDQYVEPYPSAGGPTFAGGSGGGFGGTPAPLRPSVSEELARLGGGEGETLGAIATQPQLGAPGKNRASAPDRDARESRQAIESSGADIDSDGGTSPADALSAVVSAAEGGDSSRLIAIVALLLAIAGATAVAAGLRQRRRSL